MIHPFSNDELDVYTRSLLTEAEKTIDQKIPVCLCVIRRCVHTLTMLRADELSVLSPCEQLTSEILSEVTLKFLRFGILPR